MDERLRFVARLLEGEKMAVLCCEFVERRSSIEARSEPQVSEACSILRRHELCHFGTRALMALAHAE